MNTYKVKMYVCNRGIKNGKAFGINMKRCYWLEVYRSHETRSDVIDWIEDVHNSGLLWVCNWNIEDMPR